ncbi:MAG: dihydrodipicolinate synthase family protein, partial [Oscillospiraceae bacterium]
KELAKHPNIVATKEASGDLSKIAEISANCDLDIYSGNDDQILPVLSLGGKGVISVLSNVIPKETHEICQLFFENKNAQSLDLVKKTLKLANMLFCDVNPIAVKAAMNLMGKNVGSCRLPLVDLDEGKNAMLKECLAEYNLLK